MTILTKSRMIRAVLILWASTVVAARAQTQIFQTLVNFDGANGENPGGQVNEYLTQGRDGALYGTTASGGDSGQGTVFKLNRSGKLTTIYNFSCTQNNCPNGLEPVSGVTLAMDGSFYGTTYSPSTVFRITPAGQFTTLYTFCQKTNCDDGAFPMSPLVLGPDGNLYGTTSGRGKSNGGTVFRITPSGVFTTIYSFCVGGKLGDGCLSGYSPYEPMVVGSDGSLYGVTPFGGGTGQCTSAGCGTVFKITSSGAFSVLHAFDRLDGQTPTAIMQAVDGNLYGGTAAQGPLGGGTIFRLTPGGSFTNLYSFSPPYDPGQGSGISGIQQGSDGNLYGLTGAGGNLECNAYDGCGVFFRFTLDGTLTALYDFQGTGYIQASDPIQATNGAFYGTTGQSGAYSYGTIYQISARLSPFVAFVQPTAKVGGTAQILGQGFAGTTAVSFNGVPASFEVKADTFLTAEVPPGATTGYVTVTTPTGVLTSNVPFRVIQ